MLQMKSLKITQNVSQKVYGLPIPADKIHYEAMTERDEAEYVVRKL